MPKQAVKPSKEIIKQSTNGKIDIAEALKLRLSHKLSYNAIGKYFNCSKQAVRQTLHNYLQHIDMYEQYAPLLDVKQDYMDVAELVFVLDSLDPEKRKAASLNNTAYAFTQFHQANRLERDKSTSNLAITCRWLGEGDDDK